MKKWILIPTIIISILSTQKVICRNVFERNLWGKDGTAGSNLNIDVETMTNTNLEDTDFVHSVSKGLNVGLQTGKENRLPDNFSSLGIQYADSGRDRAETTKVTYGEGNIKVGGTSSALDGINRDAAHSQDITRDRDLAKTNVNAQVNIDNILHPIDQFGKDMEIIDEGSGVLRNTLGAPHYVRNEFNNPDKADKDNGGIELGKEESVYHGEGNAKYISKDGHHERVEDEDGVLLTEESDSENMGTYNVYNPRGNATEKAGHVIVDVIPFIIFGNAPTDPSTIGNRLQKTGKGIEKTFEKWKAESQVPQATNL